MLLMEKLSCHPLLFIIAILPAIIHYQPISPIVKSEEVIRQTGKHPIRKVFIILKMKTNIYKHYLRFIPIHIFYVIYLFLHPFNGLECPLFKFS